MLVNVSGSIIDTADPHVLANFPHLAGAMTSREILAVLGALPDGADQARQAAAITRQAYAVKVMHINGKVEGINASDFPTFADYLAYLESRISSVAYASGRNACACGRANHQDSC